MINELTPDQQSGVESELIDLSSTSLTALRASDDERLHRAVHQVVERTSNVQAAVSNPTSRID